MVKTRRKFSHKQRMYPEFIGWKCANPDCEEGMTVEVHHILPLKNGGVDEYWNFICLCKKCHRGNGFHARHEDYDVQLFTWKSLQEIELFGFCLDEQDEDYYENLKTLLNRNNQETTCSFSVSKN